MNINPPNRRDWGERIIGGDEVVAGEGGRGEGRTRWIWERTSKTERLSSLNHL